MTPSVTVRIKRQGRAETARITYTDPRAPGVPILELTGGMRLSAHSSNGHGVTITAAPPAVAADMQRHGFDVASGAGMAWAIQEKARQR